MCTKDGIQVTGGKQVANNLYKMEVQLPKQVSWTLHDGCPDMHWMTNAYVNDNSDTKNSQLRKDCFQTWEVWHKCFRHVSYPGIQKLLNGHMVEGLHIDPTSDKLDCATCIQAKQHIKPFPKSTD